MACGARSGLKLINQQLALACFESQNGLWSPFGIETRVVSHLGLNPCDVRMACGARSGLKQEFGYVFVPRLLASEWPVEPVRD